MILIEHKYRVRGEEVRVHVLEHEDDLDELRAWLRGHRGPIAADTETTGLALWQPGFAVRIFQLGDGRDAFVLRTDRFAGPIRAMLAHPGYTWIFHNAPYDLLAMERVGLCDALDLHTRVTDTKLVWHLLDPRAIKDGGTGLRLKDLAKAWIDRSSPDTQSGLHKEFKSLRVGTGKYKKNGEEKTRAAVVAEGWALIPIDHPTYTLYAGLDVIFTYRLWELGTRRVERQDNTALLAWEHRIQRVGLAMERKGALIDVEWTEKLSAVWLEEYEELYARAQSLGLENLNSPKQVVEALEGRGATFTKKTSSGAWKADKAVLGALVASGGQPGELAEVILAAKKIGKRRSAYAENMLSRRDENDRVHPNLNTLQARTARMSIANPAFQQLPSKEGDWHIRRCIIASPGTSGVSTDMDQVEYRIAGALAKEPAIMQAAIDGVSIHKMTAELLFGPGYSPDQYKLAKNTGFCKLFGGGVAKVAETSGAGVEAAEDVVSRFNEAYPRMRQYGWDLQEQVMEDAGVDYGAYRQAWRDHRDNPKKRQEIQRELTEGKVGYIRTPVGRWLPVEANRAYAAVNYMVQSTARDALARGQLRCEERGLSEFMILVVHDENLAEVPTEEAHDYARAYSEAMGEEFEGVPLTATYEPENVWGESWGHKYSTDEDRAAWLADNEDEEDE